MEDKSFKSSFKIKKKINIQQENIEQKQQGENTSAYINDKIIQVPYENMNINKVLYYYYIYLDFSRNINFNAG